MSRRGDPIDPLRQISGCRGQGRGRGGENGGVGADESELSLGGEENTLRAAGMRAQLRIH